VGGPDDAYRQPSSLALSLSRVCARKEVSKDFPSIDGDRTRQMLLAEAVSEDMLAAFAREAVEIHFARCTSVAKHIRMASIPSQPRRWHARMKTMALVLCGVVALVTAYWLWKGSERLRPEQPHANQPERITLHRSSPVIGLGNDGMVTLLHVDAITGQEGGGSPSVSSPTLPLAL